MKQFFLTLLGVFTGLVTFFIVLPLIGILLIAMAAGSSKPTTPTNTVLELDLRTSITDQTPTNPFAMFGDGYSVMQIVDTLAQAETDPSVKVLLVRAPEAGMTPAYADEIRQAIQRFRKSGKSVVAHSQGFLPMGAVLSSYMVASSADELWMQDTSSFQATGLATESMFLGRAFDKYGIQADFEQRYEYKNAVNEFTQSDYTAPHREAMLAWMNSLLGTSLESIAADRDMSPVALKAVIEAGPYTSTRAVELKLIDRIGQPEEAEAAAREKAGKGAKIVKFGEYSNMKGVRTASGNNPKSTIAIVGGEGAIMTGRAGSASPFGSSAEIRSDDLARSIYKAVDDKDVKAIVFRISSPGGSPDASEQILAALRAAEAAGKPVVISMGSYAASGGYWVSSEADWIVAQPSTLTGSIGVYGGKFVYADALARFGIDTRGLSVGGEYADAYNSRAPFNGEQRVAIASSMDLIYEEFIQRVSKGRNLPIERVREIARGRVWTGAQALELGLVDQLGGVTEAIAKARQLAEIPSAEAVRYKYYPAPQSPWEALAMAFGTSGQAAKALVRIGGVMGDPAAEAMLSRVQTQRLRAEGNVLLTEQPAF